VNLLTIGEQWKKNSSFGFLALTYVSAKNQMCYLCGGFFSTIIFGSPLAGNALISAVSSKRH